MNYAKIMIQEISEESVPHPTDLCEAYKSPNYSTIYASLIPELPGTSDDFLFRKGLDIDFPSKNLKGGCHLYQVHLCSGLGIPRV